MPSDYLSPLVSMKTYQKTITQVCNKVQLLREKLNFDAIAFRGVSGMSIGFPVAERLSLTPIVVRKSIRNSHGYHIVETFEEIPTAKEQVLRYLIIDDFISTGKTVCAIVKEINIFMKYLHKTRICVGILLYNDTVEGKTREQQQKEVIFYSYNQKITIPKFFLLDSDRSGGKKLSQLDKLALNTLKGKSNEQCPRFCRKCKCSTQKTTDLIGFPSYNEEV